MNSRVEKKEKMLIAGLSLAAVTLIIICIVLYVFSDRKAPVITINSEYLEGCDLNNEAEVLKAVSAVDNRTEDVQIIIVNMIMLDEGSYKISFAAKDEAGNSVTDSVIIENDTIIENNRYLNEEIETSESEIETDQEETESVAEETTQEIILSPDAPRIKLTTNVVGINIGETFDYKEYIESITDDEDETLDLYKRIRVDGYYNTNAIGDYELTYFVTDSDGNRSNVEVIVLKVRDNQ